MNASCQRMLDLASLAVEGARRRAVGGARVMRRRSLRVGGSAADVYALWRRPQNLPRFLHHLHQVEEVTPSFSYWRVRLPSARLTLRAVLVREAPERALHWYTLGPGMRHEATIELEAIGNRSTLARVTMAYVRERPDATPLFAALLDECTDRHLALQMDRMRWLVEGASRP